MRTLKTSPEAPELVTVELPPDSEGKIAKLFLRPWGSACRLAAIRAYWAAMRATNDESVGDVAYAVGAVRAGVAGWEGFDTDVAPGEAAAFDPALLDGLELLLVEDYEAYSAVHAKYVAPALAREAEKNASSLARVGGSPAQAKTRANPSSNAGAGGATAPRAKRAAKPARSTTGSRSRTPAS